MSVAEAAREELAGLPGPLAGSTLAAAVLDLAARLDAGPGDRDAAQLVHELRMALGQLHGLAAATPEEVLDVGDTALGN